jgi:hypothetical protein
MADLVAITNALAAQITQYTGLRAEGQARDQVSPPCCVILPGQPFLTYGVTEDGAVNMNLVILVIISDAAPVEKTQRALDAYLGIGSGEAESIPGAIMMDTSLGGAVHFCIPQTADRYGRISYSGQDYFGARILCQVGAI